MSQPGFSTGESLFVVRLDERRVTRPLTLRQVLANLEKEKLTVQQLIRKEGESQWITIHAFLQQPRSDAQPPKVNTSRPPQIADDKTQRRK